MASNPNPEPEPEPDPDPNPQSDPEDDRLRRIIREEIHSIFGDDDDDPPDPGNPDDGAGMSLRQVEHRAMQLVADALAKIPGASPDNTPRSKPEPEKQPVSRAIRFLGFHDEEAK